MRHPVEGSGQDFQEVHHVRERGTVLQGREGKSLQGHALLQLPVPYSECPEGSAGNCRLGRSPQGEAHGGVDVLQPSFHVLDSRDRRQFPYQEAAILRCRFRPALQGNGRHPALPPDDSLLQQE